MDVSDLKPSVIVTGAIFPEPVHVITVVPLGDSVKLIGKGLNSGQVHEPVLSADQVTMLEVTPEMEPFDGEAGGFPKHSPGGRDPDAGLGTYAVTLSTGGVPGEYVCSHCRDHNRGGDLGQWW